MRETFANLTSEQKDSIYDNLCDCIKVREFGKIIEIAKQKIDLLYKLELSIAADDYNLYLMSNFDANKLENIRDNALILIDSNEVYFIKSGRLQMDIHNPINPKSIKINDRKGMSNALGGFPEIYNAKKCKEFIKYVLSQSILDQDIITNAKYINIDCYMETALGLMLINYNNNKGIDAVKALFSLQDTVNLEKHSQRYFYLAAKIGGPVGIYLAEQLFDFHCKLKTKLDLNFIINQNIIDTDIIGKKDFFEVVIENNNKDFFEWILQDKFIKTKIFQPNIKHLQQGIKYLSQDMFELLVKQSNLSLENMKDALEEKFIYASQEISYLEYAKEFRKESYSAITKFMFYRSLNQANSNIFWWLLQQNLWFEDYNKFSLAKMLVNIQDEQKNMVLLKIAVGNNNINLIKKLVDLKQICITDIVDCFREFELEIPEKFYDIFSNYFSNEFIAENPDLIISLLELTDSSLRYRVWELLGSSDSNSLKAILVGLDNFGLGDFILSGLFYFVEQNNLRAIQHFLSLSEFKEYLLNGNLEQTPLSIACENKHIEATKYLLKNMSSLQINKSLFKPGFYNNITSLWLSLALKYKEGVMLLMENQDINLDTGKGWHHKVRAGSLLTCTELGSANLGIISRCQGFIPHYTSLINQSEISTQVDDQQNNDKQRNDFAGSIVRPSL